MAYQYWQPQYQPDVAQTQIPYFNYNGQAYAYDMTPSPNIASSGYCSEVSPPMAYDTSTSYSNVSNTPQSIWYPQSFVKRARLPEPDTEALISQIFDQNQLITPPSKLVKKPKREYKKKVKKIDNTVQQEEPARFAENLIVDDLDDIDYDIDIDNDNENDNDSNASQVTYDCGKKKRVLNRQQRLAANVRERQRMNKMNQYFVNLRQALPISTGRKRRKMSRLDIVMGALEYIGYLESLLKCDGPIEINFNAYQDSLYFY